MHPETIARLIAHRCFPKWIAKGRGPIPAAMRRRASECLRAPVVVLGNCISGKHRSVAYAAILRYALVTMDDIRCVDVERLCEGPRQCDIENCVACEKGVDPHVDHARATNVERAGGAWRMDTLPCSVAQAARDDGLVVDVDRSCGRRLDFDGSCGGQLHAPDPEVRCTIRLLQNAPENLGLVRQKPGCQAQHLGSQRLRARTPAGTGEYGRFAGEGARGEAARAAFSVRWEEASVGPQLQTTRSETLLDRSRCLLRRVAPGKLRNRRTPIAIAGPVVAVTFCLAAVAVPQLRPLRGCGLCSGGISR